MVTGYKRGNHIFWSKDAGAWLYTSDGAPAAGNERPCPACDKRAKPCPDCGEMHDPCLGHIPGVNAACCGHGVEVGYLRELHP